MECSRNKRVAKEKPNDAQELAKTKQQISSAIYKHKNRRGQTIVSATPSIFVSPMKVTYIFAISSWLIKVTPLFFRISTTISFSSTLNTIIALLSSFEMKA